jgi:hypothetical protein
VRHQPLKHPALGPCDEEKVIGVYIIKPVVVVVVVVVGRTLKHTTHILAPKTFIYVLL